MKITLHSQTFVFVRGQAWLLPADVDKAVNSSFDIEDETSDELRDGVITIRENKSEGEFWLILSGVLVQRKADRLQARLAQFVCPEPVCITPADLAIGTLEVTVRLQGLFSVKLVDREHQARPLQSMRMAVGNVSMTIKADENGEIIFLGDLTSILSTADPAMGLCIVPM
jgi:hypothetical protein